MSAAHPSEPQSTLQAWRIVALLIAFSFMTWFNRVSMAVAYDTKIGDPQYGVSEETIGTVYSAFILSYLLFMTPGGWFADRFGAKLALVIMGIGSGLFGALTSVAGLETLRAAGLMITALWIIRFAMGLVSSPIYPAAARMVAHWLPAYQRAFANGLVQAAAAFGMACAFPVFGALVDAWDWPAAFVASGILTMLVGFVWWIVAADRPISSANASDASTGVHAGEPPLQIALPHDPGSASWLALFRNRNVILLTLSYVAVGYLEYLFFFWMNHYFGRILHVDKDRSRIYTAILYLSLAVGMIVGGWLAGRLIRTYRTRFRRAVVPMAGMALGAVLLGLGVICEDIGWIVFWLASALAAVGASEAPTWTAAVESGGRHGGTAAAIVNTGGNLGGFIAPFLTPIVAHTVRDSFGLSDQAGWQWGITLAGVLCLSGAALWWWIRPLDEAA